MRLRLLSSPILIVSVFLLCVGCGGSNSTSNNPVVPAFTNASLVGPYTFTTSGVNAGGNFTLQATFTLDGQGLVLDGHTFYVSTTTGAEGNQSVSGSYAVSPAGQVSFNLDSQILGPIMFEVVLASAEHGSLVRFENAANSLGALDKQDATLFSKSFIPGTFAFSVRGTNAVTGKPRASAGVFSADDAGHVLSGTVDTNDGGVITSNSPILPGPASAMGLVAGLGRGFLQFSTAEGLVGFNCIPVDSTHFKLMSNFPGMVTGDAYLITTAPVPSSMAFTMAGLRGTSALATGGILKTDGAGNILNTSVIDLNTGGITGGSNVTGTYAVTGNRVTMSLNSLNLVGYPSTGGIQLLTLDNATVATGVAYAQTGPFSNATASGSYSVSLSGRDSLGEVDGVAQLSAMGGGSLSGALTLNDAGLLSPSLALTSNYTADTNGRGAGTLVVPGNTLHVIFYTVDSSRILFLETDSTFVAQGMLVQQSQQ